MNLADPFWRLQHLYACKREGSGESVPFRLRTEQHAVLHRLLTRPEVPLYIVKARRLGLSTGIGIGMVDHITWNCGATGRLIERSRELAGEKMVDILRFAYLSQPREILERLEVKHKDSPTILDPKMIGLEEESRSKLLAGMSGRGGDCSWLWVSEWGPIAHQDPRRSAEIRTGALPGARRGRRVVETTWMGGKGGDLWDLVKPLLEGDPEAVGEVLFFPWHGDPQCIRLDGGPVGTDQEDYFTTLGDRLGRTFTREQKRWYVVTAKEQGIFMKREYPSTLEEAFSAPVQGAIYAAAVDRARAEGRVVPRLPLADVPVHTSWDLGAPQNAPCWMWQVVGREIHLIDYDVGIVGETITARVARLLARGYAYGTHFFPHDAAQTERSGRTFAGEARTAGLGRIAIVPATRDVWIGINALLGLFPSLIFLEPRTRPGIEALEAHHTREETTSGIVSDAPVHDWSMHPCDALRTLAEAARAGLIKLGPLPPSPTAEAPTSRPTHRPSLKRKAIMSVG
ncbi:hypothetical protein [Prosthecobacter dejongeii]|uniref:Terminase n=1 Tax=Prosthecobacter dejongeii TaxID=48465 RepID=A0A7W8DT76_9BACT|nr:hypothetical protein [Prosthecobacter dejongeii]MBB5040596.1 hypothetical protein [Prosthecobacter dejongeii]